jgi:hypothetical protein
MMDVLNITVPATTYADFCSKLISKGMRLNTSQCPHWDSHYADILHQWGNSMKNIKFLRVETQHRRYSTNPKACRKEEAS